MAIQGMPIPFEPPHRQFNWGWVLRSLVYFLTWYCVVVVCFAKGFELLGDAPDIGSAVLLSIDFLTDRTAIQNPASEFSRWLSGAEAVFGHLGPAIAIAIIFSMLPPRENT